MLWVQLSHIIIQCRLDKQMSNERIYVIPTALEKRIGLQQETEVSSYNSLRTHGSK
jgi:hypothetical protein